MSQGSNVVYHSLRLNLDKPQHLKIYKTIHNLDPTIFKSMNQFIADALEEKIDGYGRRGPQCKEGSAEDKMPVLWGDIPEIKKDLENDFMKQVDERFLVLMAKAFIGERAPSIAKQEISDDQEKESGEIEAELYDVLGDLAAEWADNS